MKKTMYLVLLISFLALIGCGSITDKPYAGASMIVMNGNNYFSESDIGISELPEGYELGGTLSKEQVQYASSVKEGSEYFFDKRRENLYDFYVYQECKVENSDEFQLAYMQYTLGGNTLSSKNIEDDRAQLEEKDNNGYPPCVMVDGIVYKDTGYVASMIGCGNMDGEITSTVDRTELPIQNNQSNFGTGYQYQGASENCIIAEIDGEKRLFRDINIDDSSIPMEVMNFEASVKEVCSNGELLVTHIRTAEGFNKMSEGDYYVPTDNLTDEVAVGDTITIWFNGLVMETYPAQLGNVYRIDRIDLDSKSTLSEEIKSSGESVDDCYIVSNADNVMHPIVTEDFSVIRTIIDDGN